MQSSASLEGLPTEIILHVLSYLDYKQTTIFCFSARKFAEILNENKYLIIDRLAMTTFYSIKDYSCEEDIVEDFFDNDNENHRGNFPLFREWDILMIRNPTNNKTKLSIMNTLIRVLMEIGSY